MKGGFEFGQKYYMDPEHRKHQDKEMNDFIRRNFDNYPFYYMEANLMQAAHTHENQVLIGGIQPNLILARLLDADFVFYPDKDMDVNGQPLANIQNPDNLPDVIELLQHPFIQELHTQIAQTQQSHPEWKIIPPFFWDCSGRATIHGIITTSFKLVGDQVMMMVMMDPDLVHAIHQWITDLYILLIRHFSESINFPVTSIHVGECSGAMLSNDQYLEFITPYVSQFGDVFGRIRLHSCGHSDHILPAISEIDHLNVIDTGSDTSIAKIREIHGLDLEINVEPPVKLMLMDAPAGDLLDWLNNALEENRGGPLKIALHLEAGYSLENCLQIYDALMEKGLIKKSAN
jgi:hypothetical protein